MGSSIILRLALGAPILLLAAFGLRKVPRLLLATFVFLPIMALLRRFVSSSGTTSLDPIVLLPPMAAAILVIKARAIGAFKRPSPLTRGVLVLAGFVIIGALNPLQGSVVVGLGGLIFLFVPLLWFWIGRALIDDRRLETVFKIVLVAGFLVALYGLSQTLVGFTSWDNRWVNANLDNAALNVNGTIRPFSSLSSAAEYASYLGAAIAVYLSWAATRRRWRPLAVAAVGILGWALVLESSRGALLIAAGGVGIVLIARYRLPLPLAAAVGVVSLLALAGVLAQLHLHGGALLSHQLAGLTDPFNSQSSSLSLHLQGVTDAFRQVLHNPIGVGSGAVTLAASKFGGHSVNSETDLSNAATALGLPGMVAYLFVMVAGIRRGYCRARSRGDFLSVAAFAVLMVTLLQWMNGAEYSVAPLPWLCLGWLDSPSRSEPPGSGEPSRIGASNRGGMARRPAQADREIRLRRAAPVTDPELAWTPYAWESDRPPPGGRRSTPVHADGSKAPGTLSIRE